MKVIGQGSSVFSVAVLLALAGCSGGGSGGGTMFVETCSLGCSSGANGDEVSCTVVATYVDQEIDVYFSDDVAPSSVSSQSMQLVDVNSGSVPNGQRFVDPLNPRKVVFRPSVSFDSQGNAQFGFLANHTYRVTVPGKAQGDSPPFIRSTSGAENASRLRCDISTSLGIIDLVPGPPVLTHVYVQQAIPSTPSIFDFIPDVDALGGPEVIDVWRNSTVKIVFADLMNPITLANPTTGQPTFLSIQVDTDGNLLTANDRATLTGNYIVTLDPVLLQTTVTFTATNGMPSSGDPAFNPLPRQVVVNIPSNVQDLAGNGLANPQTVAFIPEFVLLTPLTLPDNDGENFTDTNNEDVSHSSADWGNGLLNRGFGGGSGRLGELHITTGSTLTLDTTSTTFPLNGQVPGVGYRDLLDNSQPTTATTMGDYDPSDPSTWPNIVVTDGIFEFSSIFIESNATLVIQGTHSARLFSRGPVIIQGLIDASGVTPLAYHSNSLPGETGGAGGPNGGDGGRGASRPDTTNAGLIAAGGVHITDPTIIVNTDGDPGLGVGRDPALASTAGQGGVHFPDPYPSTTATTPPGIGGAVFTMNPNSFTCQILQIASPGSGGAYATNGGVAHPATQIGTDIQGGSNLPPVVAQGATNTVLALEPPDPESGHLIRKLNADLGYLRGGAGGGGGGGHLYDTTSNDIFASSCMGNGIAIDHYDDQSAAAGGGGGGAVQLVSGGNMSFSGILNAGGGDGGSSFAENPPPPAPAHAQGRAMPGGGGSGGAVHLQAKVVDLTLANPPRIRVDGGMGGTSANLQENTIAPAIFARGGFGGAGLIRLEDLTTDPNNPSLPGLTRAGEAPVVSPTDPAIVGQDAKNILSVGFWPVPRKRPESFTAGMSCWMKPTGNFFQVVFADDTGIGGGNPMYAWNMDVVYDNESGSGIQLIPYRGHTANTPQFPNGGTDFETGFGNMLNYGIADTAGSLFCVRFQGALLSGVLSDACNVVLSGANSQIALGSLTPWVRHPAQLNLFSPRPNMVRFCIIFDTSLVRPHQLTGFVKGVTNLKIQAQPD